MSQRGDGDRGPEDVGGTLLVGVDGRGGTELLLDSAGRLAQRLGMRVVVGHVQQLLPAGVAAGAEVLTRLCEDTELDLLLAASGALDPLGVTWAIELTQGDPVSGLGRLAEQCSAALVMVGTRGCGRAAALHRLVSGSVSARLVHLETRPVLVVPTAPGPRLQRSDDRHRHPEKWE